jgi:PAS domain S-box-containing protein
MSRTGQALPITSRIAPPGILVCDGRGAIVYADAQAAVIFGYAEIELLGRRLDAVLPNPRRSASQPRAPKGEATSFWEGPYAPKLGTADNFSGRRKDGSEVLVEVAFADATVDGQRKVIVASVSDLSERLGLRRRTEDAEASSFERLVAELIGGFVEVQPDQLDEAVPSALHRICDALGLERSTWWTIGPGPDDAVAQYTWTDPEFRIVIEGLSLHTTVPYTLRQACQGELVTFASVSEVADPIDRETFERYNVKSGIAVPFAMGGVVRAILGFSAIRAARDWPAPIVDRLRLVAAVIGQAIARVEGERDLERAREEIRVLRDLASSDNVQIRTDLKRHDLNQMVVANSHAARRALEQVQSVAPTDATVLLLGETGSGKEVFAGAIHRLSARQRRPMITVNCAAIPATLLESELFGRERGAFTGALARQVGRFELANGSTILLDEIGDLPLDMQVKLLRVLQEKVIERLGGGQTIKVDVRIIAATNRDLEKAVAEKSFREDLFYRLNVFPITIPPLRERVEDIPALVWSFIDEFSTAFRKDITSITKDSLKALQAYHWPGNVRELRNIVERAVILSSTPRLVIEPPKGASSAAAPAKRGAITRLAEIEAEQIRGVLESVGWRVRGPGGAAELLGLKANTLDSRMAKLGIRRPRP